MSEEYVDINLDDQESLAAEEEQEVSQRSHEIPAEFAEIARKYRASEQLTDDELDLIADTSLKVLRNLLSFFGAENSDIDEYDGTDGELILDIDYDESAILIGRHGKTLEALQYIFNSIMCTRLGFRFPVIIDVKGYRNRRNQKLETIAHNGARRAMTRGYDVKLHPMRAYERRIVHLTLRNVEGVKTHSEGIEPNRYVVISPLHK